MDLLLAVKKVGTRGKVIGVDMTEGIRKVARAAAEKAGLSDTQVTEYFDCYKNTSAEEKVSNDLYVTAVNFCAGKL